MKKLDFENLERLTSHEIGFDEEVDLGLNAVNDIGDKNLKEYSDESKESKKSLKQNSRQK